LRHIIELYREGYRPEQLVDHFPTLSLALVHKVIAFYLDNRAEVDSYIAQSLAEIERLAAASSEGPSQAELRRRADWSIP
jgi:hypothetical protein